MSGNGVGGRQPQRGYGPAYQRARAALLAVATHCAWCGEPGRTGHPPTADHLVPVADGGGIDGNLVAAHRSCNSGRRSAPRERGRWL